MLSTRASRSSKAASCLSVVTDEHYLNGSTRLGGAALLTMMGWLKVPPVAWGLFCVSSAFPARGFLHTYAHWVSRDQSVPPGLPGMVARTLFAPGVAAGAL